MPTTAEAAGQLGITARSVSRLIASGKIEAEKNGRDYFISQAAIDRYQNERRPVGRPASSVAPEVPIEDQMSWDGMRVLTVFRNADLIGGVLGNQHGHRYEHEQAYYGTGRVYTNFGKLQFSVDALSGSTLGIAQLAKLAQVDLVLLQEDTVPFDYTSRDVEDLRLMLTYIGYDIPVYHA